MSKGTEQVSSDRAPAGAGRHGKHPGFKASNDPASQQRRKRQQVGMNPKTEAVGKGKDQRSQTPQLFAELPSSPLLDRAARLVTNTLPIKGQKAASATPLAFSDTQTRRDVSKKKSRCMEASSPGG